MPSVILNTIFLSGTLFFLISGPSYTFTYMNALLLSSVIGVMDYIGAVNLSNKMDGLLKGELLLGTIMSLLLYSIFGLALEGNATFFGVIGHFLSSTLVGIINGLIFGAICVKLIHIAFNDTYSVISITIFVSYIVFFYK